MNKRSACVMRKAIKIMLNENVNNQRGRHHWEWFVKWLDGDDSAIVSRDVKRTEFNKPGDEKRC